MSKEKTLRKITRILMTLALVLTTVFTSVGTFGVTEVKAADEIITDLVVNVDKEKVPKLKAETKIGKKAANLQTIPDDAAPINSDKIEIKASYGWAVQATEDHVKNGYLSQEDYNRYGLLHYTVPLECFDSSYKISANDTYYIYTAMKAKAGYTFATEDNEDVSANIKSDSERFTLTYGQPEESKGNFIYLYFKIGSPEDVGYTFNEKTGKLTITSDEGIINGNKDKRTDNVNLENLTSIEIKSGVTTIYGYAFSSVASLTSVSIPDTVKTIENNVFEECSALESITIPASVTSIGTQAFSKCSALKEVKMEGTSPASIGRGVFDNTWFVNNVEKGIKVPEGTVSAYKENWSDWADYIYDSGSTGGNTGGSTGGTLNSNATAAEDSPVKGASLTNSKDELLAASGIFTDAEKQQIANGADANVWLALDKVDLSTVPEADQAAILEKAKAYMGEGTALTYFDASLFKQIAGQLAEKVAEPGISIKLTIKIPAELLTNDQNVTREYTIIRLHNGQVEEIKGAFNEAAGEFSFETDKFSTYAIAYKDTAKSNGGNGNGNGNAGGNTNTANTSATGTDTNAAADTSADNTQTAVTSPKTGESNAMMIWAMAALISLAGAGVILYRIKRA